MKRSEAFKIMRARRDFGTGYLIVSPKSCDDGGTQDPSFTHSGCDCCRGGACDVYECDVLEGEKHFEADLCGDCLCAFVNGDESSLDYHVDEEDVPGVSSVRDMERCYRVKEEKRK